MPYIPKPTVISAQSYALLNEIRSRSTDMFQSRTPLVKDAQTLKAYGEYVTGPGINEFTQLLGGTFQTIITTRNFTNDYAKFKAGLLSFGESVRDIFVNLPIAKGYTLRTDTPGELLAYNNQGMQVTWYPVNFRVHYDTSLSDYEIKECFSSESGFFDVFSAQLRRLYDKMEMDEMYMTQYVMARAILGNWDTNRIELRKGLDNTKDGAQFILSKMQKVSNDITRPRTEYTAVHNVWHSPKDKQRFWLTSDSTAQIGVYAMAEAFNLSYDQFAASTELMTSFSFTEYELEQIDQLGSELKANGYMPNYEPFTPEELAKLERVVGVITDKEFFKIYDVDLHVESIRNPQNLYTNYFLHSSRVFAYNPFVTLAVFTAPAYVEPVDVQPLAPADEIYDYNVSDLQSDIIVTGDGTHGEISGNLAFIDSGALATTWGSGNFIALKFLNIDPHASSVKVGMSPSVSSGLVEIIDDPDKAGAFKVTSTSQKFVVQTTTDAGTVKVQTYDLSGLSLAVS